MAEALLVTRNDIVKFTALNGNVDTDNFIQWVKVAQDIHIQNYLGTNLLQKLQNDIILSTQGIPTAITVTNTGTGYSNGIYNTVGGSGGGLTLDVTETGGSVTVADINNAGTGIK